MSKPSVSPEFPSSLVDEINSLAGGPYIGASYESIMRYNSYEEGSNFKMDESDILPNADAPPRPAPSGERDCIHPIFVTDPCPLPESRPAPYHRPE